MGRPRKIKLKVREKQKQRPIQTVRGMHDILPSNQKYWDFVLEITSKMIKPYSFQKIETPMVEKTELFTRGIGLATDIVSKEMFTFTDKSGESLTLRPEWTAGVARAYIEHGMITFPQPVKLYSFGPLFRHERPQAGRFRQFHQFNLEIIGGKQPVLDAEIIYLCWEILRKIGLKNLEVQINSIGCRECRPGYKEALLSFLSHKKQRLCDSCRKRMKKNPLRVLDCKKEKCQHVLGGAPQIIDFLCEECHNHFKSVLEYVDELDISYNLNSKLVRGLDYYTKTTFEIWPTTQNKSLFANKDNGAEEIPSAPVALAGGGRYDDLIELLGGKSTPAIGAALGFERIINLIKEQKVIIPEKNKKIDVLLIQLGELAKKKSLKILKSLIEGGVNVKETLHKDSIKSQLRVASSLGVKFAVILGQKEVLDKTVLIRDMENGIQEVVNMEKLLPELKKRFKEIKKRS
jgi:histidyl-tRNA synthetase